MSHLLASHESSQSRASTRWLLWSAVLLTATLGFASAQAADGFVGVKFNDSAGNGAYDGNVTDPGLDGWSIWTSILVDDFNGTIDLESWTTTSAIGETVWHEGNSTCNGAGNTQLAPITPPFVSETDDTSLAGNNGYAYMGDSNVTAFSDCDYEESGLATGGTLTFGSSGPAPVATLPASGDMFLHFNHRLSGTNTPSGFVDVAEVQVATSAGGPWDILASNKIGYPNLLDETGDLSSSDWEFISLDVSAYAGEDLYLRFYFDSVSAADNDHLGWQIDDVYVTVANDVTSTGVQPGEYSLTGLSGSSVAEAQTAGDTLPSQFLVCETEQSPYSNTYPGSFYGPAVPCWWAPEGTIDGSSGNATYDFGNAQPGSVSGYKFEDLNGNGTWEDGEPGLANWTINLYLDNGNGTFEEGTDDALVNTTLTNATGYYTFGNLTPGADYWLNETLPAGWYNTTTLPGSLTATSGGDTNVTFGNFENSTVNGTKFDDLDGDGEYDAGEPGLAGWTIFIDENGNATLDGGELFDVTNATGYYEINNITPDMLDVFAQVPLMEVGQADYCNTRADGHNLLDEFSACMPFNVIVYPMPTSGTTETIDWGNFELFNVSVFKFEDVDGDGAFDVGEPPLAGWEFNLTGSLEGSLYNTTDSFGYANFTDLGPGAYTLAENATAGWVSTLLECEDFNGTSGTDLTCEVGNFELFNVSVFKFEDMDGNGTFDGADAGIAGFEFNLTTGTSSLYNTTDSFGYANFTDLGPGAYTLAENATAGWVSTLLECEDFNGTSGTDLACDFGNFELISVSGQKFEDFNGDGVQDLGDAGLEGWNITLGSNSTLTDADGNYTFTRVGPGSYSLCETLQAGWRQTAPGSTLDGSACFTITPTSGVNVTDQDFGNWYNATINGTKFEDFLGDGSIDNDTLLGAPSEDNGLAGWTIELYNSTDDSCDVGSITLFDTTTTDADGNYSFTDVPGPGYYCVFEVLQSGWQQTYGSSSYLIYVDQSSFVSEDNDFGNFENFTLNGTKFQDLNSNGVQDVGDDGLSGWVIYLDENGNQQFDAGEPNTTSDANGFYEFTGLGPGTYQPREVNQTGWSQTNDNVTFLGISGVNVTVDFGNAQVIDVSGFKFNDLDGDGIFDAGEPGIEGWTIQIDIDDDGNATNDLNATTDANGYYAFVDVPAGSHRIFEVQNASWVQTRPADESGYDFIVVSGVDQPLYDFGNFELVNVTGTKYEDLNGDGLTDGDSGMVNVTVYFDADDSSDFTDPSDDGCTGEADEDPCDVSAADGSYDIGGVGPGPHDLLEIVPDGFTQTCGPANPLSPTSGEDVTGQDFCNWMGGSISGQKFTDLYGDGNLTGDPAFEGWTIGLFLDDGAFPGVLDEFDTFVASTTTNATGAYSFAGLEDGDYIVAEYGVDGWIQTVPGSISGPVQFNGDEPQGGTYDVTIEDGSDETGLDFGNYLPASVDGRKFLDENENGVFDEGEVGLNGWTIFALNATNGTVDSDVTHRENNLTTGLGEDGHYDLVLPPGDYLLCEDLRPGWTNTTALCVPLSLGNGDDAGPIYFGNVPSEISISGVKYEDLNGNGVRDGSTSGTLYFSRDAEECSGDGLGLFTLSTVDGSAAFVGPAGTIFCTLGLTESDDPAVLYGTRWDGLLHIATDGSGGTEVGPIGFGSPAAGEGMAFDPDTGTLYVIWGSFGTFQTVDPTDGSLGASLAFPPVVIRSLAFGNGVVYGLSDCGFETSCDNGLYAYSPGSDTWSFVGDTGIAWEQAGLAYDPGANLLYAKGEQNTTLYSLDPATGVPSVVGDTGVVEGGGLAFVSVGEPGLANWTIETRRELANFDDVGGSPTTTGLWHVTSGCGGSFYGQGNVAYFGMDSTCDYDAGFTSGLLTLPPIAIPTAGNTFLEFVYRLETERSPTRDQASIEVSANGGLSWTTVASNFGVGDPIPETLPSPPEATPGFVPTMVDMTGFGGDSVFVRFRFSSVDGDANGFLGWQVDDIAFVSQQLTAADGSYSFNPLSPGNYTVSEVLQPDWVQTQPGYSTDGSAVYEIEVDGEETDIDFGNFQLYNITGVKFEDHDGNGTRDEGDQGLEGWEIDLSVGAPTSDGGADTTNGTGVYSFADVGPGGVTLCEVVQPDWNNTLPGENGACYVFNGTSGQDVELDFGNFELVNFTGLKFNDLNADGDRDEGEPGLAGWNFTVGGAASGETETNGDGDFAFNDLGPGTYEVCEILEPGFENTTASCYTFTAMSGEDVGVVDFGNWEPASITVFKYEDMNHNGTLDLGEPPLEGWEFTLYLEGDPIANGTTNASGLLTFDDLFAGDYNVSETVQEFWENTDPGTGFTLVELSAGEDANVTFGNFEFASIHGDKIRDTNGNGTHDEGESGINNWTIYLYRELADFTLDGGSGPDLDELTATGLWHATNSTDCDDADEILGDHTHPDYAAYNTDGSYVSGDGRPIAADPGSCTFDTVDGSDVPTANSGALTTAFLPIPAEGGVLRFVYRLDVENTNPEKDRVDVSLTINDADYTVLASNYGLGGDLPQTDDWTPVEVDLSAFGGETVKLRFRFDSVDSVDNGFFGWQLDDIVFLQAVTVTEDCGYGEEIGCYWFFGLEEGTYVVREENRPGWTQTCPEDGFVRIVIPDVSGYEDDEGNDFCNQPPEGLGNITGYKWFDENGNGIWDEGEDPIPDYPIELYLGLLDVNATTTDADGYFEFRNLPPGDYTVVEGNPAPDGVETYPDGSSLGLAPTEGGCGDATPVSTEGIGSVEEEDEFGPFGWDVPLGTDCLYVLYFGNDFEEPPVPEGTVSGMKWNDIDGNGTQDGEEPGIENWVIYADLNNNSVLDAFEPVDVTDEDGNYALTGLADGTYVIREVLQPGGWSQTYPTAGYHVVVISGGAGVTGRDFGNRLAGDPEGCGTISNPDCTPGSGGSEGSDTNTVPPDPSPPSVNAGPDVTSTGTSGSFFGTASDPQSGIVSSLWELISGPAGATIGTPSNSLSTGVTVGGPTGDYTFRLTVWNAFGMSASDTVVFHHIPEEPEPSGSSPTGCGTIANPDCIPD